MSFKVEPDSLAEFALYLEGCRDDAKSMVHLIENETDLGMLGEGIYAQILGAHHSIRRAMLDRARLLESISSDCARAVDETVYLYNETDKEQAESLDANFESPTGGGERSEKPGGSQQASFSYHSVSDELEIKKKPSDLEPKAAEVESSTRGLIDFTSTMAAIREGLLTTFGLDPIDWLRSWFTGDWKVFAKCSLAWGACADALEKMHDDFGAALAKLPQVWEGNAADAAIVYFTRYRDALAVEAEAFRFWEAMYQEHMEMVYVAWKISNDLTNFIFDILIATCTSAASLLAEFLKGVATGNEAYEKISGAVAKFGVIITLLMDLIEMFNTAKDMISTGAGGYATSTLPQLPDTEGDGDSAYDRPYQDARVNAPPHYQESY